MSDAPPPAYEDAANTKKPETSSRPTHYSHSSHLDVPRNGIPALHRRSMEDEARPLPPGWVRQYDAKEGHQFFVDTNANPPRSIWHHPYDDEQYLSTLTSEERERIQATAMAPNHADIAAESSADESDAGSTHKGSHQQSHQSPQANSSTPPDLPPRPQPQTHESTGGLGKLGRKMKRSKTPIPISSCPSNPHTPWSSFRRVRAVSS
ncbi:hypothetical protein EPUS_06729 [Endocarpon pusillum Z07020]|uniref:WW domain-containing protein n=1 Tax=Endocarpon pusillum (strain Z07020 / HMAS-L-300199) TaxID=1263415 RepID=U1HPF7_ENDPU|nr:uncharacterized protein EPUS_06729 [Endocarpon pusillum Z07020]ERF70944.1 hypothetical protein EPUS_06729 [Endocarpon pusillum Z07020]